jgi:hypothetical protein
LVPDVDTWFDSVVRSIRRRATHTPGLIGFRQPAGQIRRPVHGDGLVVAVRCDAVSCHRLRHLIDLVRTRPRKSRRPPLPQNRVLDAAVVESIVCSLGDR